MKYIKTYESITDVQVGDFVQIKTNNRYPGFFEPQKTIDMVNNTIGQISSIEIGNLDIGVKYKDMPYSSLVFSKKEIVEIGKTKEEVKSKMLQKKFNL